MLNKKNKYHKNSNNGYKNMKQNKIIHISNILKNFININYNF